MKHFLILWVMASFIGCQSHVHKNSKPSDVETVLKQFVQAVAESDMESIQGMVAPNFVLYENGKIWNIDSLFHSIELYREIGINYKLDDVKIQVDCHSARAVFTNTGTFIFPNDTTVLKFVESATFVKIEEEWKVEFYHSTHIRY